MKRLLLIACLLATPAFAADAPATAGNPATEKTTTATAPAAPSLPITVTGEEYTALVTYLNEQPAKIANPVLNFLVAKQQAAQTAAGKKP